MRLIDADALHNEISERMTLFRALGKDRVVQNYDFASTVVGDAPTVDAVPVVRCRECRHLYTDEYGFPACEADAILNPEDDDYCSYGQRRDQSAGDGKADGGGGDES